MNLEHAKGLSLYCLAITTPNLLSTKLGIICTFPRPTLKPTHGVRHTDSPNPTTHSIMKAQDAKKEKKKAPQKTAKEKKLAKQQNRVKRD